MRDDEIKARLRKMGPRRIRPTLSEDEKRWARETAEKLGLLKQATQPGSPDEPQAKP